MVPLPASGEDLIDAPPSSRADAFRDRPCPPVAAPSALAADAAGHAWWRNTVGESGAAVYRLVRPGAPSLYLKHSHGPCAVDVADEGARLAWLAGRIAVPEVRRFVREADDAWLLTSALPGVTAHEALAAASPAGRAPLTDALTDFLAAFHALPVAAFPFSGDRLAVARHRVEAGLVDTDDFAEARRGWTAERVWAELTALLPLAPDPVVTHGDFSLDNLLVAGGAVTGTIDVGRAGVADRYQDLAILWDSLNAFDATLGTRMLARYGVGGGDARKLACHLLLDELF